MVPRHVYRVMREAQRKKFEPKTIPNAALLTSNVVDFTHLSTDGTPEQVTSIINKLFDMMENKLENYEDLFKVCTLINLTNMGTINNLLTIYYYNLIQLQNRSDTTMIAGESGCIVDICSLSLDILAEVRNRYLFVY